jgi:hypothetical protein
MDEDAESKFEFSDSVREYKPPESNCEDDITGNVSKETSTGFGIKISGLTTYGRT